MNQFQTRDLRLSLTNMHMQFYLYLDPIVCNTHKDIAENMYIVLSIRIEWCHFN